jgi:hypothetical protein
MNFYLQEFLAMSSPAARKAAIVEVSELPSYLLSCSCF